MLTRSINLAIWPICCLFPYVLAQSTSSASASAATHTVTVGNGGFRYAPNVTFANPGDLVVFEFYPLNHSIVRSEFAEWTGCGSGGCNPCVPYELYHPDQTGSQFFSGIHSTDTWDAANPQRWNLTINDTSPIYFYCNSVSGSCHPNGMVGAINPNQSSDVNTQFDAALSASYQLNPGDSWPAEGNTPTATASSSASSSNSGSVQLSGGAIAGIVVGVIAFVTMAGALIFFFARSQTYDKVVRNSFMGTSEPGDTSTARESYEKPPWRLSSLGGMGFGHGSPAGGRFVGYNRQTGAPEFATEAPMDNEVREMSETQSPVPEAQSPVELDSHPRGHPFLPPTKS